MTLATAIKTVARRVPKLDPEVFVNAFAHWNKAIPISSGRESLISMICRKPLIIVIPRSPSPKRPSAEFSSSADSSIQFAILVIADLTEPGDEDVIRKVMDDIAENGLDVPEEAVREKLEMLEGAAYNEIKSEYPEALEADHEGTSG